MRKPFLWLDLEMTGLDERTDRILEIACLLTTPKLEVLAEFHRVVYQPPEILTTMNPWCIENHGRSGLTAACATGVPLETAETDLLKFIEPHYKADDRIVLCGNSIHNDRRFLDAYMTRFAKRLHYRAVDVSSFKEVFREGYGIKFEKKNAHRATGDIYESLAELKFYLGFFKLNLEETKT